MELRKYTVVSIDKLVPDTQAWHHVEAETLQGAIEQAEDQYRKECIALGELPARLLDTDRNKWTMYQRHPLVVAGIFPGHIYPI